MIVSVIVLSLLVIGEAAIIFGLLNRVLRQANVPPLEMPMRRNEEEAVKPKREVSTSFRVSV